MSHVKLCLNAHKEATEVEKHNAVGNLGLGVWERKKIKNSSSDSDAQI